MSFISSLQSRIHRNHFKIQSFQIFENQKKKKIQIITSLTDRVFNLDKNLTSLSKNSNIQKKKKNPFCKKTISLEHSKGGRSSTSVTKKKKKIINLHARKS